MSMSSMSVARLFSMTIALCFSLLVNKPAHADEKFDMERLDAIQTVSDRDNEEGLRLLQDFKSKLTAETTDTIRLETLKILVGLYYDAGKIKASDATVTELLQFAEQHHNKDAIALAQITKSFRILDDGKPDLALAKLKEVQESVKNSKDPEVNMRLNSAFGVMYKLTGKFEQALTHSLEALRLSEYQPRRKIQARLYRLYAVATLYWNMKDPEKSLATIKEALALSPLASAPKISASLLTAQGIALSSLGKHDEALDAYQKSLKIGIESSMPSVESTALINIADHFLIAKDYRQAEFYSRKAIVKAESINDKDGIASGKVNLGFALGGQGKIAQGVSYVNEVIAYFQAS
ncbi:MAG: tetratricopeptide repeat protein, partial [Pseudomonadota bacterium]